MGRHRSAGPSPSTTLTPRRSPLQESPRRAARSAAREAARAQARVERARRVDSSRTRRSRHTSLPVAQRLAALPWVTFVLLGLVVAATAGILRPEVFEAGSTVAAPTPTAAARAAVALSDPDLPAEVEQHVELAPDLRRTVRLSVERPERRPTDVVVRALAPDPRLAAVAADTAAALVVGDREELAVSEAAVVPDGPVDRGSWWPWALAGAALLALAGLVEHRHDVRERAGHDPATAAAGATR